MLIKKIFSNKRITGAFFLTIISYVNLGVGFIVQAIFARILGAQDYGIVSLVLAYPSLMFSITSPKSVSVITQYIAKYRPENKINEILTICFFGYCFDLATSSIAVIGILLTSGFISVNLYKIPEATYLIKIYTFSLPFFAITSTSMAVINGYEKYNIIGWLQLISKISLPVSFFLLMPIIKYPLLDLIWAYAAANYLYGFLSVVVSLHLLCQNNVINQYTIRIAKQQIFLEDGISLLRELAGNYTWNFALVTITGFMSQLPIMILGSLGEAKNAGFYRLASMIANSTNYPKTSLARTLLPKLAAESKDSNWIDTIPNLKRWTLKIGMPLSISILMLCALIPLIVKIMYGSDYTEAITGIQILIAGSSVLSLFYWLEPFYYAYSQYKLFSYLHFAYFFLFVGLTSLLTFEFGFTGMCFADLLSKVFLVGLLVIFARRCIEVRV